jgi:hypothetical protein
MVTRVELCFAQAVYRASVTFTLGKPHLMELHEPLKFPRSTRPQSDDCKTPDE